jgi:hypothetical protein
MTSIDRNETHEEKLARLDREFWELARAPIPPPRPKPIDVVVVPLKAEDAVIVRAAPESVRLVARRDDGVTQMMKPQPNPNRVTVLVDRVTEVDGCGRPVWPKGGAVHEYDPLKALD